MKGDTFLVERGFRAKTDEVGKRVDTVLQRRFGQWSRAQWQRRIRAESVFIDQSPCRQAYRLKKDELVSYRFWHKAEPPVNPHIQIEYEDEDLALIHKPSNLPVHPSGTYHQNTLYSLLKGRWGEDIPIRLVHRLDRETSGLILVAKNRKAAFRLQEDFQNGQVKKEYLVIVEGLFPNYYDAVGWLYPDPLSPVKKKRCFNARRPQAEYLQKAYQGRPWAFCKLESCRTEFFCLERDYEQSLSLLCARLHSGRTHQIRASLCSSGYPLVGDRIYGWDPNMYLRFLKDRETMTDQKRLRIGRTALHAFGLEFFHPSDRPTGRQALSFSVPLPEDMASVLDPLASKTDKHWPITYHDLPPLIAPATGKKHS